MDILLTRLQFLDNRKNSDSVFYNLITNNFHRENSNFLWEIGRYVCSLEPLRDYYYYCYYYYYLEFYILPHQAKRKKIALPTMCTICLTMEI